MATDDKHPDTGTHTAGGAHEFTARAVIGVQSGSGFEEGRPVSTSW